MAERATDDNVTTRGETEVTNNSTSTNPHVENRLARLPREIIQEQIMRQLTIHDSICTGLTCKMLYEIHRLLNPDAVTLNMESPPLYTRLVKYLGHPRDSHMCKLNDGRDVWMEHGLCVYYPKCCCTCKRDRRIPGQYNRSWVEDRNKEVRKRTRWVLFG